MPRRSAANDFYDPEPRWPAAVAIVAVAGLYYSLPEHLIVGPRWAFPALVLLLIPTVVSHARQLHSLNRTMGFTGPGAP